MKDLIKIGIPSKGRLRKDVLKIFNKRLEGFLFSFENRHFTFLTIFNLFLLNFLMFPFFTDDL